MKYSLPHLFRSARRGFFFTTALGAASLFFCTAPVVRPDTAPVAAAPVSTPAAKEAAPKTTPFGTYMRFVRLSEDDYAMQLAVRTFKPATGKGPKVTLVSAVHIGSPDYYERLQKILDARKLLLFEGVSDEPDTFKQRSAARAAKVKADVDIAVVNADAKSDPKPDSKPDAKSTAPVKRKIKTAAAAPEGDTLYDHIAKAAGLTTQMNGINYDRKHFQNADLSLREMRELLAAEIRQGGAVAREAREAQKLMGQAEGMLRGGGGFAMFLVRGITGFVGSSPQLRTLFLYQLGTVEDKQALLSSGWAPPGLRRLERLLLDDRNEHVMGELKKVLSRRRLPRDVGVFYGAAHLGGMEKILVEQMGYKLEKTEWLTAFTMQPAAAGLPRPVLDNFARRAAKNGPAK